MIPLPYNKYSQSYMKGGVLFICGTIVCLMANASELSFTGNSRKIITVYPEKNTGLDAIYVADGADGLSAHFDYTGLETPVWYRYSNLGGGFSEKVSGVVNDGISSTVNDITAGYGYIIECGDKRFYYYIVDYSEHPLTLESLEAASQQDCTSTIINVNGSGSPLVYYTINGQQRSLDRELRLQYETEEWDESSRQFVKVNAEKNISNFSNHISVTPPAYCSTYFVLTGDRFLREWGMEESVESAVLQPVAIDVRSYAEQEKKESGDDEEGNKSNEITSPGGELGGSAPAEISFYAFGTEGVIHNEWQMATDPEFENITYRITERDLDFTFRDEGTVYVRFVGSNADGSCESYSDTYTVNIGASELYCPNAFSPGASEGVNDEWKVSYKSLVDFKCWIFDRYGTQMCYFDDPSKGWDGRYRGKLVKPGVYYYVIQATGSEGKKYKKSGDINIIRYKSYSGSGVTE